MDIRKLDNARREIKRAMHCLDRHILLQTIPTFDELEHCHRTLDLADDVVAEAIIDVECDEKAFAYVTAHAEPQS